MHGEVVDSSVAERLAVIRNMLDTKPRPIFYFVKEGEGFGVVAVVIDHHDLEILVECRAQ